MRVGNAASGQFQLDVYGEVLSAIYVARERSGCRSARRTRGRSYERSSSTSSGLAAARRRHLGGARRPPPLHALEGHGLGGDRSRRCGSSMSSAIGGEAGRAHAAAPARRCASGSTTRSASAASTRGSARSRSPTAARRSTRACSSSRTSAFFPATDPRVQGTVAAVEKTLLRDGFVLRYATEHGTDGLPGTEGAFLACSFWLADNYAFAGRIDEAEELFERLLGLRNHLGLLAEEYDPTLQRQIGNFPQAFSHLALIFTAHIIESCRQGARQPQKNVLPASADGGRGGARGGRRPRAVPN